MKAIRVKKFGLPEAMVLEDMPEPKPQAGQILVDVKAVGVNPVDAYIRSGTYSTRELPFTPGFDAAGIVAAIGEGVAKVKTGDRVYTAGTLTGAYAQTVLCTEAQVHPLPVALSFQQGACVGVPYATALRALFHKAHAKPAETVLVHGATGGVGIAAVQLARAHGMRVIGTGGTEKGRELARAQGAHHALDHRSATYLDEVMKITSGRGVDVIIEFLANVNLGKDLKVLSKFGRVTVVGCRGSVEIDPRDAMSKDASINAMSLFNATEPELASVHAALIAGFENSTLKPVVGREMELKDAAKAHHAIMEESAYGKIVLIP